MEFAAPSALRTHQLVHSAERRFACTMCDAKFAQPCNLTRHVGDTHKDGRRFSCSICAATFTRKESLEYHANIHLGLRPFVCTHAGCGAGFRSLCVLRKHAAVHGPP